MESEADEFTSNEEFEALTPGDTTVDVRGYVDAIEGTRHVGSVTKKALFKFILNNGSGKRIRILMWEQQAAKFESLITLKMIVHITRGKALPVNAQYVQVGEDLVPFEISVQRNTITDLLGQYQSPEEIENTVYHKIRIEDICARDGYVSVEGFIKVPFESTIAGSPSSYGSGAVTDGTYKLRVQITNFRDREDLSIGVHVMLNGEIKKDKFDTKFLQVEDTSNISVVDDKKLTIQQSRRGFRAPAPKRQQIDTQKENIIKKKKEKKYSED